MKKSVWLGLLAAALLFSPTAFAQGHKDCDTIEKQIEDIPDLICQAREDLGKAEGHLEAAEEHLKDPNIQAHPEARKSIENSINSFKSSIASLKSTIAKHRANIRNLLDKFCACCGGRSGGPTKDCDALERQIEDIPDRICQAREDLGKAEGHLEAAEEHLKDPNIQAHPEARKSIENSINSFKNSIASLKSTIAKNRANLRNLLDKLCECCSKGSEHAGKPPPGPTPSTTDKVTDILRTIGGSVSIGVGGGSTSGRHHDTLRGADRTKTAERVPTDSKTHKTSPSTTSPKKTVTAGCKCHPCTCSPCTCH